MNLTSSMHPLGELCDVLDRQRKPITKKDRVPGEYPYYGATGILDYVEDYIFDESLILVGEDGAKWGAGENTAFGVRGKYWVNNHAHDIRPHRDTVLDQWIIYYLNASDLSPFITGLTVPKLNQAKLREIPVPTPPVPEQRRIVAILDEAFEGIATATANAEKNLKNARELFESYLNAVFTQKGEGWTTRSLSEFCENDRAITYGVIKLGNEVSDGIPCLRTSNVRWLYIDTEGHKKIDPRLSEEYKRTILRGGEVLVNVRGTLGGVAVATQEMVGWNISREVAVVPADPSLINPEYLSYWIGTKTSQDWLTGVQKGVAYTGINLADLRALPVAFPDLKLQTLFVNKIGKMITQARHLEAIYQKKLIALAELKQSLLQKAFSGELTAESAPTIKEEALA